MITAKFFTVIVVLPFLFFAALYQALKSKPFILVYCFLTTSTKKKFKKLKLDVYCPHRGLGRPGQISLLLTTERGQHAISGISKHLSFRSVK